MSNGDKNLFHLCLTESLILAAGDSGRESGKYLIMDSVHSNILKKEILKKFLVLHNKKGMK